MPIKILDQLPAAKILRNENILLMTSACDKYHTLHPLKIIILNLMSNKIETENNFLRLLSYSPLKIDIYLLRIDNRKSKNTSSDHLNKFYYHFDDIKNKNFDGLIVTGAPLGLLNFCDVIFWPKINLIFNWAKKNVTSILFICWSVQAALNIFYNIPKITRKKKLSGIFQHKIIKSHIPLIRGFDELFSVPHSRYSDFPIEVINQNSDLEILSLSNEAGAYLFISKNEQLIFVTGHPEYNALTLANEYNREIKNDLKPTLPLNYFPKNNSNLTPQNNWRSHSYLLFSNWIHFYVYKNKI